MFESLTQILNTGPGLYSALGFLLAAFLGELLAPVPSPLLLVGAAFFFKSPYSWMLLYKAIVYVALPLAIGSTGGAIVIFIIAYKGGKPALERSRKYLRFSWEDVEKVEKRLSKRKYDVWILFISRCIPLVPTTVGNILAGLIRMNPESYIVVTFVGIFLRILLLLFIFHSFGYLFF
jgi:membrane protein DedA with SNARE-associated domain